jgi:uncharacterized protein (TIGR02118 family)
MSNKEENAVINLKILYPKEHGAHFDWDYYTKTHIPLAKEEGKQYGVKISAFKGIEGVNGDSGPYLAIADVTVESKQDLQNLLSSDVWKTIRGRTTNYTNIKPNFQISEVVVDS